jgi:aspartate/glutamate racemase
MPPTAPRFTASSGEELVAGRILDTSRDRYRAVIRRLVEAGSR